MATALSNSGKGTAFDARVQLGHSFATISQPINVAVYDGTGAALAHSYTGGVVSIDELAGSAVRDGTDSTGSNVAIVVYDVDVLDAFVPGTAVSVSAQLQQYLAIDNSGINYVSTLHATGQYPRTCTEAKTVALTGVEPVLSSQVATTDDCTTESQSNTEVAIGEEFTITSTFELPRGTLPSAEIELDYSGSYGA